jgi:hypothetical protein
MAPVSKGLFGVYDESILTPANLYRPAAVTSNGAIRRLIAKILTFAVHHGALAALYQKR